MKNGIARSPLFYVGDKYKLIREIRTHFPAHINRLIEPFVGGGSVMMNVNADGYLLPAGMWDASGSMQMHPFPYESFLNLQMLPLSRCGVSSQSEFYC